MSGALPLALRVLVAEGLRGFAERARGRFSEWQRARSFSPARADEPLGAPVLNLLGTPPWPHLGGVQVQLAARLAAERASRPVALLFPQGGRFRLEHEAGGSQGVGRPRRRALDLGPAPPWPPPALASPELERAVLAAAMRTGASLLHLENPAGLPLASLLRLAELDEGPRWVLSVHDFGLFCPRPHLLEEPVRAFCRYSTDPGRCAACLAEDWPVGLGFQEERRTIARRLLAAAAAVVYPSEFLRRRHLELFPGLDPARQQVIAPAAGIDRLPPRLAPAAPPRHVAFAGSFQAHKGALVFEEVVRRLGPRYPRVTWSLFGGGDAALLTRLRRLPGVRVRGFYRPGTLPRLLRRDGVDLVLLLSVWPESYGFTWEECAAAGVPIVSFDLGAPAERLRELGGGVLVPAEGGAEALAARLDALLSGREPVPPPRTAPAAPTPQEAAAAWLALYRELESGPALRER